MNTAPLRAPGAGLRALLLLIAAIAIAAPAWFALHAPHIPAIVPPAIAGMPAARVVPADVVPAVEATEYVDLSPEDARAYNDGIPFSTAPNPAARPFTVRGDEASIARATDCLAAGVLYEAGNDRDGQRAVAQVVLNRLRHPAFPKTVCGVVFEGQDRATGCQFTFTCDGALTRWTPGDASWAQARAVAIAALHGAVYRRVGYATHYHTDWVVPYWQASLDKIAAVHSHLFFRWAGWWGTPGAFHREVDPNEPVIAKLAAVSEAHRSAAALTDAQAAVADGALLLAGAPLRPVAGDPDTFLVAIPAGLEPALLPSLARQTCGERARCRFSAWRDAAATPAALPLTSEQVGTMTFGYLRSRLDALERTLWNCQQVPQKDPAACMKAQPPRPPSDRGQLIAPTGVLNVPAPQLRPGAGVRDLGDVRRKGDDVPTAVPATAAVPKAE